MRLIRIPVHFFVLLLLPLSSCVKDFCADNPCAPPEQCEPLIGKCVSRCTNVRCPTDATCDVSIGRCIPFTEPPAFPELGSVISRMGRPVVSTLLLNPFDTYRPGGAATPEDGKASREQYSADGNADGWVSRWSPYFAYSLSLYDALDGTCGNSLLSQTTSPRYGLIAATLADDQLYVDVSIRTCQAYLGVEQRQKPGLIPDDCGGRMVRTDVVDATLSSAVGSGPGTVIDGVNFEINSADKFPFIGGPPP